jgi:transcriptional regulator with XRE-family HTH domain
MKQDELRKKLSRFLKEKDMTLIKAGIYFGVTGATLSKFTNNKTNLNKRSQYKIEKGLGVTS